MSWAFAFKNVNALLAWWIELNLAILKNLFLYFLGHRAQLPQETRIHLPFAVSNDRSIVVIVMLHHEQYRQARPLTDVLQGKQLSATELEPMPFLNACIQPQPFHSIKTQGWIKFIWNKIYFALCWLVHKTRLKFQTEHLLTDSDSRLSFRPKFVSNSPRLKSEIKQNGVQFCAKSQNPVVASFGCKCI